MYRPRILGRASLWAVPLGRRNVGFLAAVLASLLFPTRSASQSVTSLTNGCPSCSISFDTVAVLGSRAGPGSLASDEVRVATDDQGRYYVLSQGAQAIQVFSPDGRFLKTIGREGEGPGEFLFPHAINVDAAGRLLVVDGLQRRLTVFDRDGVAERTFRLLDLTPGYELFSLPGDSILVAAHSFSRDLFGLPAHVFSPEGRRVRSFGAPEGPITAREDASRLQRRLAPARDGRIWIASSRDEYHVEAWSLAGERLAIFDGEVDWFEPVERLRNAPPPPKAMLASMREGPDGLLWLQFSLPGERWHEAARRSPGGSHGWRMVRPDLWVETVFDVVDPSGGRILARARRPGEFTMLFGRDDMLVGRTEVELDEQLVRLFILRVRLERPPGP